jgi:putative ABC transport system permease protein
VHLLRRIWFLLTRRKRDRELQAEIDSHIQQVVDDLVAGGMSLEDARYEARRRFGNPTRAMQESRSIWAFASLDAVGADLRLAGRAMRRSPGFFSILIALIAGGIAATTAMFSIVQSLFMRPLPYPEPGQLTAMRTTLAQGHSFPVTVPDFLEWKAQATTFEKMGASRWDSFGLASGGPAPERLQGANVSGEFFSALQIRPLLGRLLVPEDDKVGGPRVVVLSASLWRRRFGSDPAIIGQTITLNGLPHVVVGVAPEGFRFALLGGHPADLWTPLAVSYTDYALQTADAFDYYILSVIGRRKSGVTIEQAQQEMSLIASRLEQAHPEWNSKKGIWLVDLREHLVDESRGAVWVVFACVALVFLIVCANVANLLLMRAQSRRSEMAARLALGASEARALALVLTETLLVFAIASIAGFFLARYLVGFLSAGVVVAGGARSIHIQVDNAAFLFCNAVCLACGLVCGLVPGVALSRIDPQTVLKQSAAQVGGGHSNRTLGALVVVQVALACSLLIGSGLALRAFGDLVAIPPGFDGNDLAMGRMELPKARYPRHEQVVEFFREVLARVGAQSGVTAVTANSSPPITGSPMNAIQIEGRPPFPVEAHIAMGFHTVVPGYFKTMGIPIIRGRDFTAMDRADNRPVMIIGQAEAERDFPDQDPIGHRIDWAFNDGPWDHLWREIVGVVGDVRRNGIDAPIRPEGYIPLSQNPYCHEMTVMARSTRAEALVRDLPAMVQAIDPEQDVSDPALMSDVMSDSIKAQRYVTTLLAAFAASALLLATLGVFGLVSYATNQRMRELAIRMALGSTSGGIIRLVIRSAVPLFAIGLGIGLLGAIVLGRVLASRISGLHSFDILIFAAVPPILGVSATLASLLPAVRAARLSPSRALRDS